MDKNYVTFSQLGRHGEFGNQLFQISTVIAYARHNNMEYIFPEWECQKSTIKYSEFFKNPIPQDSDFINTIDFNAYFEPRFKYSELPFIANKNIDLCGYFQSELYFQNNRDEILKYFQPSDAILNKISNLDYANSVGLQLRSYDSSRPAYSANANPQSDPNNGHLYYYTLEENSDFVEKAVAFFGKNKTYYVSSNNWDLSKKLFGHLKNLVFMEDYSHIERFFIQSLCEHNIISNSTFGWWSAWLNKNPDKKVIAPSKWFRSTYKSQEDASTLIPSSWKIF